MDTSVTDGILGAIIFVAVILAVYLIATKKSPWNLPNQAPNDWPKKKWILVIVGVIVALLLVVWLWLSQTTSLHSPPLKEVWKWTKDYWLWILLILAVPFFALFAVTKPWTKALQGFLVAVAVMFFVVVPMLARMKGDEEPSPPQDAKPMLSMPANGDSPRIRTRPGYAVDYSGSGFSIHCIYRDGSEGIVGDPVKPCGDGPMLEQYVRDTTGKANIATYKFVRP